MPRPEAQLFVDADIGEPYRGLLGLVNTCIERSLERSGYSTRTFVTDAPLGWEQATPLEPAALRAAIESSKAPALSVFTDKALCALQPRRSGRGKNVVFFHGLKYNAGAFLQPSGIHGYCANSDYLKAVLLSVLLYPGADLTPQIEGEVIVGSAPLMAPCARYPKGFPTAEPSHRRELRAHLGTKGKAWFAHAIRPGKANAFATLSILAHLDDAVRRAFRGSVKLFVYERDYERFRRAAATLPGRIDVDDLIIPVPFLSNEDLYWLMRRCKFCLCYDDYPEPFGVYPLDAVFNGTAVYTSGAGNLRCLLPDGSGIVTHETADMWIGPAPHRFAAFKPVADRIFRDASTGVGASEVRRWQSEINTRYSFEAFDCALFQMIERTRNPRRLAKLELSRLRLTLGPLVRSWSRRDGRVVSDYVHLRLTRQQNEILGGALGRTIANLRASPARFRETLHELFRFGVVTWSAPFGPHVRLAGKQAG
jgi:hypothetical protein